MELTNIQKQIVETTESKVIVLSSAASGKSRVIVERIKYLLNQGVDPSKIVAITFTNNAASVMYERLGYPNGLFIGTVHSYANYLLRGGAIDTSNILSEERFDDLFEEIKKNTDCIKEVDFLLGFPQYLLFLHLLKLCLLQDMHNLIFLNLLNQKTLCMSEI